MKDIQFEDLVLAVEYVMKNDAVLNEYSKYSPAHFVRIIERTLQYVEELGRK